MSLLPECLCSRLTSTLAELEAASEALRPDIELPGALRWLRRRRQCVRAVLAAAIGLLRGLLAGCTPTVSSIRFGPRPSALGLEAEVVLVRLV